MIREVLAIVIVWGIAMILLEREFQRIRRERIFLAFAELSAEMRQIRKAFIAIGVAARAAGSNMERFGATLAEVWTEP